MALTDLFNIPISESYHKVVQTEFGGIYNTLADGSGSTINKIGVAGNGYFIAVNGSDSIIYAPDQIKPSGPSSKTVGTPLNPFDLVYAETAVNIGSDNITGKINLIEANSGSNPVVLGAGTSPYTGEQRVEASGPIKSIFTKNDAEGNRLVLTKERGSGISAQVGDYSGIIDMKVASSSFLNLVDVAGNTTRLSSKVTAVTPVGVRGSLVIEGSKAGSETTITEIMKIGQDEVANVSGFGVDMTASLMVGDLTPFIFLEDQFNGYQLAQLSKLTNLPSNDEGTLRLYKTGVEKVLITAGGNSFISGGLDIEGGLTVDGIDVSASLASIIDEVFPYTGSAGISGSLEVNGTISATNYIGTGSDLYGVQKAITISDTAPASPVAGDLWYNSDTLATLLYYVDADSSQWVSIDGSGGTINNPTEFADGTLVAPSITFASDSTIGLFKSGSGVAFASSGNDVMRYDTNRVYIDNLTLEGIGDVRTAISSSANADGWQEIVDVVLPTGTTKLYGYDPDDIGGCVVHYRVCDDNNAIGRTGTLHVINTSDGSAVNYSDAGSSDIGNTAGVNIYAEYNLGLDEIEVFIFVPTNLFSVTAKALYI